MKRLFLLISFFLFTHVALAAETYTIDSKHTDVVWQINHYGFSSPSGKWMAEGTLVLDEAHPTNSKVNATIQVANISTGLDDLNKHLKGQLFFDVKKFPTATFVSDKVILRNKKMAKVTGTLTLHGVSKPITLDVKLNKIGINPVTNKKTVGFSADTKLNRSDFNINTLLPGLGDEVKIHIEMEAFIP